MGPQSAFVFAVCNKLVIIIVHRDTGYAESRAVSH